jgi:hypothetical protein
VLQASAGGGATTSSGALSAPIQFAAPTTGAHRIFAVDDRSRYPVSAPAVF